MARKRDPPAKNAYPKRRGLEEFSVSVDEIAFSRCSETCRSTFDGQFGGSTIGESHSELDSGLIEEARRCIMRYRERQRQRGMSYGEEDVRQVDSNLLLSKLQTTYDNLNITQRLDRHESRHIDLEEVRPQDPEECRRDELVEETLSIGSSAAEEEARADGYDEIFNSNVVGLRSISFDTSRKSVIGVMPGFWVSLFDFLTCSITNVCTSPREGPSKEWNANLQYEMPVLSINLDHAEEDVEQWGRGDSEQESLKPTKIAKAINFSSNRLDDNHPGIALYDENKLRQEVHEVEVTDGYMEQFDLEAMEEAEDYYDECFDMARAVPDAVVVQQKKLDDISVLEDNSVEDSYVGHSVHAWSLSPQRKRRLQARARAVGAEK